MGKYNYKKLKELREEKGITQIQMSELLNMTQSNYSKLENGVKKIDSISTLEGLGMALDISVDRLKSILSGNDNIKHSGIKTVELKMVEDVLKDSPLREDEFVFLSTEVLELNKHDFKNDYPSVNIEELNDDELDYVSMDIFMEPINIKISDTLELGTEYQNGVVSGIEIWLANQKLGVISQEYVILINELMKKSKISRAVLIENEDCIAGFQSTYMKVVFIVTNAECSSVEYKNGRFSSLRLLSKQEIENN